MLPIKHLFHINAPVTDVFKAISRPEGLSQWYTSIVKGEFKLNGVVTFEFVNFATFKFKIIQFVENESIHFEFVESEFPNLGHIMKYHLDQNENKTRVRYTYEGFTEMDDSYSNMNFSSGKYLESLRQYCQNGVGEAFGSRNYRS